MKNLCTWAAVAALCFSFVGCHGDSTSHFPAVIKSLESVSIDSNTCEVTVCGTVKLGTREGVLVDTTVHVFLGNAGQSMDELLADAESFSATSIELVASEADEDGCIRVCATITLPPGERPLAVRADTAARLGTLTPVQLVNGLPASGIGNLSCRVIGVDVVLEWSNLTPVHADEIVVLLRPGTPDEQSTILPGDATTLTIEGSLTAGVADLIRLIASNKYGSAEAVECTVKRPGTPRVLCELVGDKIIITWSSEANSVELFENGVSLGTFAGSGSTELCDRNPGTYVYTAVGTGLEDQPEAVSDVSEPCELHRKARLILTQCVEEGEDEEQEYEAEEVLRVLLDGSNVPTLVNAKVLTLSLGKTELADGLRVEAESRGSCSFFDVFFDIDYQTDDDRGEWQTEILSLSLNGSAQPFSAEGGEGSSETLRIDEPGTVEIVLVAEASREVEVDNNGDEPNGDTVETEIVALQLTGTAQIDQTPTPLFGVGDEELGIADARYADLYLDNQSNVGNRTFMRPEVVHGYGFGYGTASGYINVHGSARGWYRDSFSAHGYVRTKDRHFFHHHHDVYPIWVHGSTSGPVYSDVWAGGYARLDVRTRVSVLVPVEIEEGIDNDLVGYLAGFSALGGPDCRAFGIGREAGHLTLGFCDNIIIDGPGFDVRIYERSTPDATESFFLHTYLDRFFHKSADTWTGRAPSYEKGPQFFDLPIDVDVPTVELGLGYAVTEREDCDGYIIDLDLASLGIDCLNLTTLVSGGEGNTIDGRLRDLFAGADIDAICGVNNLFGLRVEPLRCNEEDEPQRDLFINGLTTNSGEGEYQREEFIWKYVFCGQVYCDGLKGDVLETNAVDVQSYLAPYYFRHYLKVNNLEDLSDAAEEAGEEFGADLDFDND